MDPNNVPSGVCYVKDDQCATTDGRLGGKNVEGMVQMPALVL
jgi:hypothetical protein